VNRRHHPQPLLLDLSIFVGDDVPLGNDACPRNLGMGLLNGWRDAARRFAEDFDRPLDRELRFTVRQVGGDGEPCDQLAERLSSF